MLLQTMHFLLLLMVHRIAFVVPFEEWEFLQRRLDALLCCLNFVALIA